MELFRPIEANNNGQMVPQAESIWEGNYTNAVVARDAKQNANSRDELLRAFHPLEQVAIKLQLFWEYCLAELEFCCLFFFFLL